MRIAIGDGDVVERLETPEHRQDMNQLSIYMRVIHRDKFKPIIINSTTQYISKTGIEHGKQVRIDPGENIEPRETRKIKPLQLAKTYNPHCPSLPFHSQAKESAAVGSIHCFRESAHRRT